MERRTEIKNEIKKNVSDFNARGPLSYPGIITIDVSSVPSGKKEGKKDKGRIKILTGREREGGRLRENKCVCVFL